MCLRGNEMNGNGGDMDLAEIIIEGEWAMFQSVSNIGGRADCQDNRRTFEIMRRSQFRAWNREALESYALDLAVAVSEGRNLPAEKYARMMESTDPQRFSEIKDTLPKLSEAAIQMIDRISGIHLAWNRECAEMYPALFANARPVESSEDAFGITSSETYWRGELATYSERTLKRYLEYALSAEEEGRNLCEEILDNTMREYGFCSAAQAEATEERK